jgi:hypothetical protein
MNGRTRILLNFSKDQWYPRGAARLAESLGRVKYGGATWFATDEQQIGCPTHQESPYAFKPAMFAKAADDGYDLALWCDAAIWACRPLEPVFDHIQTHGHMLFYNGMVGNWSSDAALESFGINRDTAMGINEIIGCCIGLNLKHPRSQLFLKLWREKSMDGKTFPGSWHNNNQEVSKDPRVRGHRHDQTAASIIAWQLEMEKWVAHEVEHPAGKGLFQYYENPTKTAYIYGQNDDMSMISSGVCLLNQGM